MDTKALAKSKRAHSQHHKNKFHSHHKSKAPAVASENAGSKEKQPGKQVGAGTRESRCLSRLPSNWDRYEDEFDLDSADPSVDSTSQASGVVVPKSKGTDYRHLITEAHSQTPSYSDAFHSLVDVMPRVFIQGMGSMLSIRGESILSWVGDDNFIVGDKNTEFQEASFLSLNLNALAEQLAKVDLSERLFVEADLLTSELETEGSNASSNQELGHMPVKHESEAAADIARDIATAFDDISEGEGEAMVQKVAAANISEDMASTDFSNKVKIVDTESISVVGHSYNLDAICSNQKPDLLNRAKDLHSNFEEPLGQSKGLELMTRFNENVVLFPKNLPNFEAAAAEAELDMRLDSFSETKFLDSSSSKSRDTVSVSREAHSTDPPQFSRNGPDLLRKAPVTASFDDVLDDLLEETCNLTKENGLSQPLNIKVNPREKQSSSSQSVTKSEVLEDFNSWLDTI